VCAHGSNCSASGYGLSQETAECRVKVQSACALNTLYMPSFVFIANLRNAPLLLKLHFRSVCLGFSQRWNTTQYSPLKVSRSFGGTCHLEETCEASGNQKLCNYEDGGEIFLRNSGPLYGIHCATCRKKLLFIAVMTLKCDSCTHLCTS
jgi:hypothetical protein